MLELTAHLPDPGIGLTPVLQRLADLLVQDLPDTVVQAVGCPEVKVDRVEQAPQTSCCFCAYAALPIRTGRELAYPGRWSSSRSVALLAPDAVHDLDVVLALHQIGDEGEEVHCLPVQAQCTEPHRANVASRIQVKR